MLHKIHRIQKGFTLVELMIVVAIIGILAAVAIPAFMKYIRHSKTTEALMNIRKLYDASVSYFETEHANQSGNMIPKQFPATQASTPSAGACCPTKCKASSYVASWATASWQALNFSVDDPFYYSYQYDSSGTETTSLFSASAQGDLNCDGSVYSLFQRFGFIQNGNVAGGAGLYITNENE